MSIGLIIVIVFGAFAVLASVAQGIKSRPRKKEVPEIEELEIESKEIHISDRKKLRREHSAIMRLKDKITKEGEEVEREKKRLELVFENLSLIRQEIFQEREKNAFLEQKTAYNLQQTLDKISSAEKALSLHKREFDLHQDKQKFGIDKERFNLEIVERNLQVYNREVKLFVDTFQKDYQLKLKDLDQKQVDQQQKNREERLQIEKTYNANLHTLKSLELVSKSNAIDNRELESRRSVIQAYIDGVYHQGGTTELSAYYKAGFAMESPLMKENLMLEKQLWVLAQENSALRASKD